MPDAKITDLGDGGLPQPTDDFVVARAGTNNKLAWSSLAAAATEGNVAINASNATYTSGTVVLTGAGGGVTIGSAAGQQVVVSVAAPVAQSVQTQNVVDLTLDGNTAGALQLVSSGTLTLAGGNNITLSQNGNAITISGPNAGGAQTGISSIGNSETTYTSGAIDLVEAGALTIASGAPQQFIFSVPNTSSLSATGAVSISTNGSTITIGAPVQSTQVETQTFIAGVSASDTLYTSGNVRISGSNAVTVKSGTGQLVVIDVPVQSTQPETQTFIAGISASDTLYTSGNVRFTGVGGGITVGSNTGQRVDLSVAAPVAQTNQSGNVYASSNTFGTSSGTYDARTISIAGSGAVSVAASNSGWVISAPSQTNQAGSVYAISNTSGTSSGTYDARTLSIAGAGIVTVAASNSGWRINASQSVQAGSVYASSNTFGTSSGTYDARTLSIAGSGAVSVAASNSGWVISAPVAVAQTNQSGNVYASSNTFGTSSGTYDARSISIAGSGAVSVAASNSGWVVSAPAQTAQTQGILAVGASTGGNTAGDTGVASGTRLVFVGSNNITISQGTAANATTLTISGPTAAAQTNQAGSVYAISNTSGTSSGTYDARTLSIAGAGLVTVAASNSGWRVDATNQNLSIGVSTGGNTAGNTTVNTGSRFVIVGSNGITASAGTAAGATTITISGVTTAAQTNQSGNVYASSNTFGTSSGTYDARSISIAGAGIVSVAASNSGWVISASEVPQTNQAGAVYAISNTSGTSSGTYDARTLSIAGAGLVTIAASNSGWRVDATNQNLSVGASNVGNTSGNTTVNTGSRLVFAGGNNITISQGTAAGATTITISAPNLGAGAFSGGVSTGGNTAGATGITGTQNVFVGVTPISLSQTTGANGATISINAPATSSLSATGIVSISTNGSTISVGAPAYSGGFSTMGNTAGDTGYASQRLNLAGGNNITLSGSTNGGSMTVTISAGAGGAGGIRGGVSTGGNTAGSTGTISTGNMVLVGVSPISLSQSTGAAGSDATVSILAPATSSLSATGGIEISTNGSTISIGYKHTLADYENFPRQQASLNSHVSGFSKTPIYWNEHIDGDLTAKSLAWGLSMVTASQPLSVTVHMGFYTLANSTSANLLGSFSEEYVISSATSVSLSGIRNVIATKIGTHATLSTISGGEYIIGMMFSATATNAMNFSLLGASGGAGPLGGLYPGTNQYSAATNQNIQAMAGRGSTTVNAMPNAISSADMRNQGGGASQILHPWIYIRS